MCAQRTVGSRRAAAIAASAAALALCPQFAGGVTPADAPGPLSLAEPVVQAKTPSDVYIVQLKQPGAAAYKGGLLGMPATKPVAGRRLDAGSAVVEGYVRYLEDSHQRLLTSIDARDARIYSFRYAFNGFAARLNGGELGRLARRPEVHRIWRDTEHHLSTNNSSLFLGVLDQQGGLRADLKLTGENVIVGIIDSGIATGHPSLRDYEEEIPRACRSEWARASWLGRWLCHSIRNNPPTTQVYDPPADWRGVCQAGENFQASDCNNKLIGARYYIDGFLFRNALDPGEYLSPKDADGHGTHLATIVAGNSTDASLFGTRVATISGIAPRARIAVYKACWLKPGESRASCATSDLARAIDDAVADGVDIINYSVGSLETDLTAPEDIALLNALDAGVLSVVAAGNDGPDNFTIGSPSSAPWVLTVAASTQTGTRYEEAIEVTSPADLADLLYIREASFTRSLGDSVAIEGDLALVDDGQDSLSGGGLGSTADACEPLINASELSGQIALIERGGCDFQLKLERVEAAGALAAIVYNTSGPPIVMNGTGNPVGIPGVMISAADGDFLLDALFAGDLVTMRMERGVFAESRDTGNQMADFSSRGPSLSDSDFVKPDLTAPGVNILGGNSPDIANGLRGELFQYLSGTSMAAPEVAGVAALIKEAKPEWSPAVIKSALMTTAYNDVVTEDGEFLANAFDMGSGHVDANLALDPGLVYEAGYEDHAAYLCGLAEPIFSPTECNELAAAGYPSAASQVNLPSIGVTELIPGDVVTRRVTNFGPSGTWTATLTPPAGVAVTVAPPALTLATGESGEYSLTFDSTGAEYDFWQFGSLNFTDGSRFVATPIAVQPVYLRAPVEIDLAGPSGSGQLAVDFGYSDAYFSGVHGLHAPGLNEAGAVADDPANNYSFRFDNGVTAHFFTLAPDELFLRVALFDELTDGDDDLDLYLYFCPALNACTQVGQSGSFTADERIDLVLPEAGFYAALVHGFQTDEVAGGPGADYQLMAWSFGPDDDAGNMSIVAPTSVQSGDRLNFNYDWGPLNPDTRYLGAFSHDTPFGIFFLSIVTANMP